MNKNVVAVLFWSGLILFGGATASPAQLNFRSPAAGELQKSQRKAERVVVRALGSFGRTLDFTNVYQTAFVKDKAVRKREDAPLLAGFIDRQTLARIDAATFERAFVKSQNLYWMFAVFSLQENGGDLGQIESALPRLLSEKQRVIYERIMSEHEDPLAGSPAEIADYLAVYGKMTGALRQQISPVTKRQLQRSITARADRLSTAAAGENTFRVSVRIDDKSFPFSFVTTEKSGAVKILSVSIDD